jgi:hypothetical protein
MQVGGQLPILALHPVHVGTMIPWLVNPVDTAPAGALPQPGLFPLRPGPMTTPELAEPLLAPEGAPAVAVPLVPMTVPLVAPDVPVPEVLMVPLVAVPLAAVPLVAVPDVVDPAAEVPLAVPDAVDPAAEVPLAVPDGLVDPLVTLPLVAPVELPTPLLDPDAVLVPEPLPVCGTGVALLQAAAMRSAVQGIVRSQELVFIDDVLLDRYGPS